MSVACAQCWQFATPYRFRPDEDEAVDANPAGGGGLFAAILASGEPYSSETYLIPDLSLVLDRLPGD
jgi:hypothetical protein